jgi:glycosyltransferase involved in cell wall biosynthesis
VTLSEVAHGYQYVPWLAPLRPPRDASLVLANSWNAAAFLRHGLPLVSVCHLVVHDRHLDAYKGRFQALFHRTFVKRMERKAIRDAAMNIAVSPTVARQMHDLLGAGEVRIVENGVDTDFFCPAEGGLPSYPSGRPFRLLFVGKPSLRKGFDIIAKIVERLGDRVHFTCVGEVPGRGLPLPPGSYTGVQNRVGVRAAYRAADLLLFPSRMEGFGLAAAEAMACCVPVAACRGSAVDDLIPEGDGIIRQSNDIDGFVQDISELMNNSPRRSALRERLRQHAVTNLSEERWIAQMEDALLSLSSDGALKGGL